MPPSASRVASMFHAAYGGGWANISQASKEAVFGAWVFHLRQHLNGRPGTVYMGGRPKPTKVTVDGDARIKLVGFAVPEVGFVEYDDDRRQVRVLSRSGGVLSHANVNIRFTRTVSGLKQAGKDLAYQSILLLNDIKRNTPDATRAQKDDRQTLERQKLDKELAEAERRRNWAESHINGPELVAGLERAGIKATYQDNLTGGVIWLNGYSFKVSWGTVESTNVYFWFLSSGSDYGLLPDGSRSHDGRVPAMPKGDAIPLIVKGVKAALTKIEAAAAQKKEETPEAEEVWSVARDGYMLEDAGEAEADHSQGYIAEVETFTSKAKALAYAKDIAPAYLVRGTQMWNEPVGQVEEHDRRAWYQLVQAG